MPSWTSLIVRTGRATPLRSESTTRTRVLPGSGGAVPTTGMWRGVTGRGATVRWPDARCTGIPTRRAGGDAPPPTTGSVVVVTSARSLSPVGATAGHGAGVLAAPPGATGGAAGRSTTGASRSVASSATCAVGTVSPATSSSSSVAMPSVSGTAESTASAPPTAGCASRAAGKPRGGEAGTPQGGSGSPAPSLPGGAPSRCTGSFGTIEVDGRDHGPVAAPPTCSGVPGPLRFLRTGSGMPVGGSDGPPSGVPDVSSPVAGRTIGIGPLTGSAGSAAGPGVCTECRGT